jgi:hypothetical protein
MLWKRCNDILIGHIERREFKAEVVEKLVILGNRAIQLSSCAAIKDIHNNLAVPSSVREIDGLTAMIDLLEGIINVGVNLNRVSIETGIGKKRKID